MELWHEAIQDMGLDLLDTRLAAVVGDGVRDGWHWCNVYYERGLDNCLDGLWMRHCCGVDNCAGFPYNPYIIN